MSVDTHRWNLERQYQQSYVKGSKEHTRIKSRLLDTVGDREGGVIRENSLQTDALSYVE